MEYDSLIKDTNTMGRIWIIKFLYFIMVISAIAISLLLFNPRKELASIVYSLLWIVFAFAWKWALENYPSCIIYFPSVHVFLSAIYLGEITISKSQDHLSLIPM